MSQLHSDVVADCAYPADRSVMDEKKYYAFDPKYKDLKAPDNDNPDSGFGSVGVSATKSLREELEIEDESCTTSLTTGLQTLQISQEHHNRTMPHMAISTFVETDELDDVTEYLDDRIENKLSYEAFEQDDDGDTALHLAVIHNRLDVAEAIIDQAPSSEYLNIHNDLLQVSSNLSCKIP